MGNTGKIVARVRTPFVMVWIVLGKFPIFCRLLNLYPINLWAPLDGGIPRSGPPGPGPDGPPKSAAPS